MDSITKDECNTGSLREYNVWKIILLKYWSALKLEKEQAEIGTKLNIYYKKK